MKGDSLAGFACPRPSGAGFFGLDGPRSGPTGRRLRYSCPLPANRGEPDPLGPDVGPLPVICPSHARLHRPPFDSLPFHGFHFRACSCHLLRLIINGCACVGSLSRKETDIMCLARKGYPNSIRGTRSHPTGQPTRWEPSCAFKPSRLKR